MTKLQMVEPSALVRAQSGQRTGVIQLNLAKMMCIAVVWSAAISTLAAAQTFTKSVTFTTLFTFDGGTNGGNPAGPLVQARDGNLYGTTYDGGANTYANCPAANCGTFFKISPGGKLTTLYNFCSQANCADGGAPSGPLVLGADGDFYGITEVGGTGAGCSASGACGTAFKITPSGVLTTLYNWCSQPSCADGAYVLLAEPGTFVQATDGNFYGTNDAGCPAACAGTVFKLTPGGSLKALYTFCSQTSCTDGEFPTGLIQAADGNFYGTTNTGGANGNGTVFKITPGGTLTTLYSFCSQTNCTDGALPGPLIQAADGNLYGMTEFGGTSTNQLCDGSCGTVFEIATAGGSPATLYNFCSLIDCTDGASPAFSLVQATDGNFYGSTLGGNGGNNQYGITLFTITPAGVLTTTHTFNTVSQTPEALFQATNGTFYGVTLEGGNYNCGPFNCGIVFSLAVGLGPFVETVPTAGRVGTKVDILGQGLKGTTAVSFNGTAAKFVVHSNTYLTATVPSGATTGYVTVTTPKRKLKSNKEFRVIP